VELSASLEIALEPGPAFDTVVGQLALDAGFGEVRAERRTLGREAEEARKREEQLAFFTNGPVHVFCSR
jgi:hypothetical protein